MENVLQFILTNIIISIGIYLIIATVLVLLNGKPKKNTLNENKLSFEELDLDYTELPALDTYACRDGIDLNYRYYPAHADKVLILLHGSGWHSQYFMPMAREISLEGLAHVYTPDLRGHGIHPIKRGDIAYTNQLEDDLSDFVQMIRGKHPNAMLVIGGHSSGGGLAVRFAGSQYGEAADAYFLLSPYLKYNAPTMQVNSGGWASTHMPRIIGLSMLNKIGISWFDYLPVIDFNMPEAYRNGTETLTYSHRLNTGFAPREYKKDLHAMKQKLFVIVGTADESFVAEAFLPEISTYKKDVEGVLLEDVTHMGVVVGKEARPHIKKWMRERD